jgi:hypothetical protein
MTSAVSRASEGLRSLYDTVWKRSELHYQVRTVQK